uniref:5-hydroxyisourate hydrolase n=1 Tax=Sinocyclocheilus grahami TaxID=75366 RepID=A0A672K0B2_SINGR
GQNCNKSVKSHYLYNHQRFESQTHVLNTGDGVPAARVALSLHRLDPRMAIWNLMTIGWDGRCPGLITSDGFTPGMYKIRFETGQYWESLGQFSFCPYVEVCEYDADQSLHVPLLVSSYSYSTYRGS